MATQTHVYFDSQWLAICDHRHLIPGRHSYHLVFCGLPDGLDVRGMTAEELCNEETGGIPETRQAASSAF